MRTISQLTRNTAGVSRLAWTAGIVIGASLPHWTMQPLWITALLIACVAWRFASRLLRWPAPGPWLLRLMTLVAFVGVWFAFGTVNGLTPGTGLLVVMVALKFLEARTQRDHMILAVIAYFLAFASLLDGGGIFSAAYLFVFVWITTLGLLQVGRQGTLLPGRISGRFAGTVLLQSLPFMLLLFVTFPRLSGPLWSSPLDDGGAVTGLSGSMSPGDMTNLALNDDIAFRVDFFDRVPEGPELYWRGPVLSQFDGRGWQWRPWPMRDADEDEDKLELVGRRTGYRVTLDPDSRGWLFALDMPGSFETDHDRVRVLMRGDYQLFLPGGEPPGRTVRYTVESFSDYRARESLTANQLQQLTDAKARNPRTRALVAEISRDAPNDLALIQRTLDYFAGEAFYYTLAPPLLGEHATDEFIFDTRQGFCEHYASAFAVMMRMAGLPARVVTGFQGAEYNPFGDYWFVRWSNAHAWTEVYTDELGWVRVDPVATVSPERISLGSTRSMRRPGESLTRRLSNSSFLRQLALRWDAANTFWNNWIIGYRPQLQSELFGRFGFDGIRRETLLLMTIGGTCLLLLVLGLHVSLKARAWRASTDPATQSFRRFIRTLKKLSIEPPQRGETPMAYAHRAAAAQPEHRASIVRITTAYLAARYEPDLSGAAGQRLADLVRDFRPRYARASR